MENPICVYTAPLKALSSEKFDEWSRGVFRDKNIVMLTGDTLTSQKIRQQKMRECENAHIVLCTSELLDSLTRNHGSEHYAWIYRVGLVIVDECHIIASQGRGDCVESAIMRFTSINPAAKVWLLSATAPNADQFSTWLTHLNGKPTHVLNSSWRPTTLVWHYLQHEIFGSYQENQMSKMVNALQIMQSKPDEKYLVFVWDKNTGRMLSKLLQDENINNSFYNADVEYGDRRHILQRFETPELNALISTPALAWGCNTSAQNVIIVGNTRGLDPIDELDIIQAAGRAGRFGKAPEGHVYFICDSPKDWEVRINNPRNVESTLLDEDTLSFHLCAEIRNKVITDVESMHDWYNRTLSVIQRPLTPAMVEGVMNKLAMWDAIKMDDNGKLSCTPLGIVAATLYYHPKDVFHWAIGLSVIDQHNLWHNDYAIAYLLAAPTVRLPYIPRKDEMRVITAKQQLIKVWPYSAVGSSLFADLVDVLKGEKPSPAARAIQQDIDRVVGALSWIAGIKRVANLNMVQILALRLKYGVPMELAMLCQIPGVGAARAKKLYDVGITSISAVLGSPGIVRKVLGNTVGNGVLDSARDFVESDNAVA